MINVKIPLQPWLFIAYSDEKWLYYKFSLHHSYNRFLKGWENTLLSSGVKGLTRVERAVGVVTEMVAKKPCNSESFSAFFAGFQVLWIFMHEVMNSYKPCFSSFMYWPNFSLMTFAPSFLIIPFSLSPSLVLRLAVTRTCKAWQQNCYANCTGKRKPRRTRPGNSSLFRN